MLTVAIVHHHLRGGGVSRVIANAIEALASEPVRAAIFVGEPPADTPPRDVPVVVVDGLGYADSQHMADPKDLESRLRRAAHAALGGAPAVWHVHNHCLGKNPAVTLATEAMARAGDPLLLHIHDFAEDGRPAHYRFLNETLTQTATERGMRALYPTGNRVHYAVLNQRDSRALLRAGLSSTRCHVLSNPVFLNSDDDPPSPTSDGWIVYPTRAIRRKNLGEFLLWSIAAPENRYAVTLAPKNPQARTIYEEWVRFANSADLPVTFEFGEASNQPFAAILSSATAAASTSTGEGFGLAFLEPWLVRTPILGRDLPAITQDFKDCGIDLRSLYRRLDIPLQWVGAKRFEHRLTEAMRRTWERYGRPLPADAVTTAFASATHKDMVDFGRLDEPLQRSALAALRCEPHWREHLREQIFGPLPQARESTRANREAVGRQFSLPAYGKRLSSLYQTVAETSASPSASLPPSRLLDAFLDPETFMLLRT